MNRGNARQIGCAMLVTAAVAFPAGLWLAGSGPNPSPSVIPALVGTDESVRKPYSATIRTDAYVIRRQRALVDTMERGCRLDGLGCAEARAARAYLQRIAPD